eukprot:TRINITY_DN28295_c0_g1_i1.p1 TRINITY_DN28295_c0_g1~~TRINITY_DN28295_c0_g1_i1.p1  ORF type:complete len:347 (+),score=96.26 TRINITY_DN28295_c0_g1_i1:339-1379(+)
MALVQLLTPESTAEKVQELVAFFATRLLLKRYRKDVRDDSAPAAVAECEAAFEKLARDAISTVEGGETLDAMVWLDICADFSKTWLEVCHWVSPKKLREFFSTTIGAMWVRVSEVPAAREQPPVDLKWYKNPEGNAPVQPCICPACNVMCNSLAQFVAHTQGKSHKSLAKAYIKQHAGVKKVEAVLCSPGSQKGLRQSRAQAEKAAKKKNKEKVDPKVASCDEASSSSAHSTPSVSASNVCTPPMRHTLWGSVCSSAAGSLMALPEVTSTENDSSDEDTVVLPGDDEACHRREALQSQLSVLTDFTDNGSIVSKGSLSWGDLPKAVINSPVQGDIFLFSCNKHSIW